MPEDICAAKYRCPTVSCLVAKGHVPIAHMSVLRTRTYLEKHYSSMFRHLNMSHNALFYFQLFQLVTERGKICSVLQADLSMSLPLILQNRNELVVLQFAQIFLIF